MIRLTDIKPLPIFSDGRSVDSEVWNQKLYFQKGKKYLIEAASGKGKSTLLHIIYGLRKDYEGQSLIEDKASESFSLDDWSDLRSQQLSIVFQDLRLFPQLTALENIQLNNRPYLKSAADIQSMAERLGVEHLLSKLCQNLSYGQRQRIAIIRALCQNFDCLLLDEPFSHLDEANIKAALRLILETVKQQEAAMILVSLGDNYDLDFDEILHL